MANNPSGERLTREQTQERTRRRLLAAARAVVAQRGFIGASVRDIAESAGYSQGAFYSNFASKEALMIDLMREHMHEEAAHLERIVELADGSREALLARLDDWMQSLNSDADWSMLAVELQLHARRSPAFAEEYGRLWQRHLKRLGDFVAQLFEIAGSKLPAKPEDLAAGLAALAHGLSLHRTEQRPDPAGRLIAVFLQALLTSGRQSI